VSRKSSEKKREKETDGGKKEGEKEKRSESPGKFKIQRLKVEENKITSPPLSYSTPIPDTNITSANLPETPKTNNSTDPSMSITIGGGLPEIVSTSRLMIDGDTGNKKLESPRKEKRKK